MNIHRYLLPTSLAAAVHVALLLALPRENWLPPGKVIELPLPPWTKPEEVITLPEEKPEKSAEVVKALGEPAPELPDPVPRQPKVVPVALEPVPLNPHTGTKVIPRIPGPGEIGLPGPGELTGTRIYASEWLDRVPHAKVQIAPDYPAALRHSGTTGFVQVEFDVDTAGRVTEARVVGSSHREFEEPTLRAVRRWRFEPGMRRGTAVPFRMVVPVEFGIEPD